MDLFFLLGACKRGEKNSELNVLTGTPGCLDTSNDQIKFSGKRNFDKDRFQLFW